MALAFRKTSLSTVKPSCSVSRVAVPRAVRPASRVMVKAEPTQVREGNAPGLAV